MGPASGADEPGILHTPRTGHASAGVTSRHARAPARVNSAGALPLWQALVRIPTVNPPGEEYRAGAEFIGRQLNAFGYDVQYVTADERPEHTAEHPRVNGAYRDGHNSLAAGIIDIADATERNSFRIKAAVQG